MFTLPVILIYIICHSERQRRICIKMLHFVQHDSKFILHNSEYAQHSSESVQHDSQMKTAKV